MSSNEHTSSVMLLLKQRASNVDQLLKKQKKLEKSAKDMKLEIKRLKEEILIKDQMIQQIRETPDQTLEKNYEKGAFIEENKTMQAALKEKEKCILEAEKIILSKTNELLQKEHDLKQKIDIIDLRNEEITEKEKCIQSKDIEIMQKEELVQKQNEALRYLEEQIFNMRTNTSHKSLSNLQNYKQGICNKCETAYQIKNEYKLLNKSNSSAQKDDLHTDFQTAFQENTSTKSIFDIDGRLSSDENTLDHINDRYCNTASYDKDGSNKNLRILLETDIEASPVRSTPFVETNRITEPRKYEDKVENCNASMTIHSSLPKKDVNLYTEISSKEIDRQDLEESKITNSGTTVSKNNATLKFLAPIRKKFNKPKEDGKNNLVQFSKLGCFDVRDKIFIYRHNLREPCDVLKSNYRYMKSKYSENILAFPKGDNEIVNPQPLSPLNDETANLEIGLQEDNENKIRKPSKNISLSTSKKKNKPFHSTIKRKRKGSTVQDSQDEMRPPAKTSLLTHYNAEQTTPKNSSQGMDSCPDIWSPQRFARYDAEKNNSFPTNADARARAIAILAKSPLKYQKKSSAFKPAVQLEDDLDISDSSDQESNSPEKPNEKCDPVYNKQKSGSLSETNDYVEKTTNPFIIPIIQANTRSCDLAINKNKVSNKTKRSLSIEEPKIPNNPVPSSNYPDAPVPESSAKGKNFKHKKFDSVKYVPLGQSFSTLKICTERAASSLDKDSRCFSVSSLETNVTKNLISSSADPKSESTEYQMSVSKNLRITENRVNIKCGPKKSYKNLGSVISDEESKSIHATIPTNNKEVQQLKKYGTKDKSANKMLQNGNQENTVAEKNPPNCALNAAKAKDHKLSKHAICDKIERIEILSGDTECSYQKEARSCSDIQNSPLNDNRCGSDNIAMEECVSTKLDHTGETYLGLMLDHFKSYSKEKNVIREKRKHSFKSATDVNEDLDVNLIKSQFGRLWKGVSQSTFDNIVEQFANLCRRPNGIGTSFRFLVVQCVYMEIRDEKTWEDINEVANNAPLMTEKQSKILAMLISLHRSATKENEDNLSSLIEELLRFIRYSIFGKDGGGLPRMQTFKISQLANLTRMFMALVRFIGDERTARMFLFDIMYFRSPRSHVMINVFFDTWPEILFWTGNVETAIDPFLETVIWMIYNTGPSTSLADMKVHEARHKLKDLCGFPKPPSTGDELIKHLIDQTEKKIDHLFLKSGTCKSLLLLAKWQEWKWSHNHIISRLLEVMRKCLESDDKVDFKRKPQKLLTWVVDCIGNVSRVYPAEGRERLREIFEPIKNILTENKETKLLTAELEESCLRALIWTGHHLQVQVAEFLISWKPKHPQSPEVIELVRNFVGTRGEKYCQTTIKVWKKKNIYETLNAQVSQ